MYVEQQLRWNIQEQVFQRYFQQEQKYEEWGKLDEHDTYVGCCNESRGSLFLLIVSFASEDEYFSFQVKDEQIYWPRRSFMTMLFETQWEREMLRG